MYTHTPLLHRQLREAHTEFSLLFTEHDDEADMQAYIYPNPQRTPSFLDVERTCFPFSFFFFAQIQICSNIYMVITTKL